MEAINGSAQLKALGLDVPNSASQKKADDKNVFLELFITQLQNQDPLNPQDASAMLGQLAQFSTVEGINNMQNTFSRLETTMQSSQALQASSLVGRQVQVPTELGVLKPTGQIQGTLALPQAVSDLTITIRDAAGQVVKEISMGEAAQGEVAFHWDGTDENGNRMNPGAYHVAARASLDGTPTALQTFINADVASVTIAQGQNNIMLNLIGHGPVSIKDVKTIN
jgi:flagellar basal-body rod modification protein FlgD